MIKASGSRYRPFKTKKMEINDFYRKEDWENYAILVHALKSTAKMVGAYYMYSTWRVRNPIRRHMGTSGYRESLLITCQLLIR